MIFEFRQTKWVEYRDVREYGARVGAWISQREAENSRILGELTEYLTEGRAQVGQARFFSLEEQGAIQAAGLLSATGDFHCTWATSAMVSAMVDGLAATGCEITSVRSQAFTAWDFANAWADRRKVPWQAGLEERVYQLDRLAYTPAASGRLMVAGEGDLALAITWLGELGKGWADGDIAMAARRLIAGKQLFFWMNPGVVAMAAWVAPTLRGGRIDHIYVPAELRGRGHGKSAVSALARTMLEAGKHYCFVFSETGDRRANHVLQTLGARTVAELLSCSFQTSGVALHQGADRSSLGVAAK